MATTAERIAELEELRGLLFDALKRLATTGGAVSIAGRTWTPINIRELREELRRTEVDIARLQGRAFTMQRGKFVAS